MQGDLNGKIALITGASRGIGKATALKLAQSGAHVVLLARTQGALEDLDDQIRENGGQASLIPMDLNKLADIDKLGAALFERFGHLDIFIGAAGALGMLTPVHHAQHKDIEKAMRLNFTANARLIRSLDPLLRAAPSAKALFLSGDIARNPMAYWGIYAASKAALECWVATYALELKQTNITADIVRLPPTDTAMLKEAFPGGFQGKMLSPEEAADMICAKL